MDQRQIERFIDVVESGSLSRTSHRLNITQPALSKSLRLLEDQLGTKLLERGPRGVRPTKSGDIFYRRARTISAEFRRAREDLDELKGLTAGEVALGVTPGPGVLDRMIPSAVLNVATKRPALNILVRSGTVSELLVELNRGDLDLLLTVLDERIEGANLKTHLLFDDHVVVAVGRRHPLVSRNNITIEDLARYRWVFLEDAMPLWRAIEEYARDHKTPMQTAPIQSNSVAFVRAMVNKNDLIAMLPSYAVRPGKDSGDLRYIEVERIVDQKVLPKLVRPMGLVYPADIELTAAGHALFRSITSVCREMALTPDERRVGRVN